MAKSVLIIGTGCLMLIGSAGYCGETGIWPTLPETNAECMIPAQEWPREPGPREVKVYITYPGGALANVSAETGLFLDLHNWGGTFHAGTADPEQLANRYNVVAICVDYLQSGPGEEHEPPYDFGYLQALDALRGLYLVYHGLDERGAAFHKGRIYCTGGSGGGNVTLMANKLAPRTFACCIDKCGMARLTGDIAFNLDGGSELDARYSPDPESPRYLSHGAQALRYVGNPEHLAVIKQLGNSVKMIVVHGAEDAVCPVEDAREMVANMEASGMDIEAIWVTKEMLDGETFQSTGHPMGDRTRIVFYAADKYLAPGSPDLVVRQGPTDFERKEAIRYEVPGGVYVISYENGYPVGTFERAKEG